MDLHSLKNEGWTNTEIAEELGYHPATVAKWLKAGDPPDRVAAADERPVMTSVWRGVIPPPMVLRGAKPRGVARNDCRRRRRRGFAPLGPGAMLMTRLVDSSPWGRLVFVRLGSVNVCSGGCHMPVLN